MDLNEIFYLCLFSPAIIRLYISPFFSYITPFRVPIFLLTPYCLGLRFISRKNRPSCIIRHYPILRFCLYFRHYSTYSPDFFPNSILSGSALDLNKNFTILDYPPLPAFKFLLISRPFSSSSEINVRHLRLYAITITRFSLYFDHYST